jgi:hypothetical protein
MPDSVLRFLCGKSVVFAVAVSPFVSDPVTVAQTPGAASPGLPMAEVRACAIEYQNVPMAIQGRWGGQIAVYDATIDPRGVVVAFKRRIVEGREHLPPLVRLDQFEECVRRWRFDGQGAYEISLLGGTVWQGEWVIQVKQDNRVFRLRFPVVKRGG